MSPPELQRHRNGHGPRLYSLHGLTRSHGSGAISVRAIDGIDLEIEAGEFVVISGPSGSGKTTLLQLLGALDRPSEGTVEFEGRSLADLDDRELAELRLRTFGFIFQQFNLIPTLTASENVEVALAPAGLDAEARPRRAGLLLGQVGLAGRAKHLPSELSGGEQQRVAIARALANEPRVLLADEPTGNLDTRTGEAILALLYELWEATGVTVVVNTHDQGIASAAPRVLRLADGRIAGEEANQAGATRPDPAAGPER